MGKRLIIINDQLVPSTQVLVDTLNQHGFEAKCVLPRTSPDFLMTEDFWRELLETDLILYRGGMGSVGSALLWDRVKNTHITLINEVSVRNNVAFEKMYQVSIVQKLGVRLPKTIVIKKTPFNTLAEALGLPFIMKGSRGARGEKVFLIENEDAYVSARKNLKRGVVYQEFIPNTGDYRVFIIDGKVHGIFKRTQSGTDFRSNISVGGSGERVTDEELRSRLSDIALQLAREFGFEICGVDLMQSAKDDQIYFIEINTSPNWEGLDATLGLNTPLTLTTWIKEKYA